MTSNLANITIQSNSTLSDFSFDTLTKPISFNISGDEGTTGYCNVSIPHVLPTGNPWLITVNEKLKGYNPVQNSTHTSLHFNYVHLDNLQIEISGRENIPEIPTYLVVPFFVIVTLIAVFSKKYLKFKYESKEVSN